MREEDGRSPLDTKHFTGILCNKNGPERLELFLVADEKPHRERGNETARCGLGEGNTNTDLEQNGGQLRIKDNLAQVSDVEKIIAKYNSAVRI